MKTMITIPDQIFRDLLALCEEENISRTEAISRAIAQYVATHKERKNAKEGLMRSFGAWKDAGIEDGVEYQRKLRAEWAHRDWEW